jgi:hypothetical protein
LNDKIFGLKEVLRVAGSKSAFVALGRQFAVDRAKAKVYVAILLLSTIAWGHDTVTVPHLVWKALASIGVIKANFDDQCNNPPAAAAELDKDRYGTTEMMIMICGSMQWYEQYRIV